MNPQHPTARRALLFFCALWMLPSLAYALREREATNNWDLKALMADAESPLSGWGSGRRQRQSPPPLPLSTSSPTIDARLQDVEASLPSTRPRLIQWSDDLIEENGGTILAIAGDDYCVLAADTRLSADYQIRSRNVTRIMKASPRTALGTAGGWADLIALRKELGYELGRYTSLHGVMSTSALATFLSNRLYLHRLKPLYALNVVAGLDSKGVGSVYTYDAVGSYNRVAAACCGRGQKLMQPVLDGLAEKSFSGDDHLGSCVQISCDEAVKVVKEAFLSGAEREISIGDEVEILVFRAGSRAPEIFRFPLPRH